MIMEINRESLKAVEILSFKPKSTRIRKHRNSDPRWKLVSRIFKWTMLSSLPFMVLTEIFNGIGCRAARTIVGM